MEVACATCGNVFLAKRSTARFCSDSCRVRAHRAKGPKLAAAVAAAAPRAAGGKVERPTTPDGEPLSVEDAVRAELEKADRVGTVMGQSALVIARRLDMPTMDTGSAVSTMVKQLSATLDEALAGQSKAVDPLDELRARRARKLGAAG
ncbi:hypothetical protein [Arthrobacter sp.]|uniref:hypothetical protein n=1 Tax=Arthrobacter sp. TaxID=1667 RepID=UPI003A9337AC